MKLKKEECDIVKRAIEETNLVLESLEKVLSSSKSKKQFEELGWALTGIDTLKSMEREELNDVYMRLDEKVAEE